MTKFHQGKFTPKNVEKYKGNPNNIIFRSSWELSVLRKFDAHPNVLQYSSECVIVPYISPLDGKRHRYYVDFWVRLKNKEGNIVETLIEIKPLKETMPPPQRRKGQKETTWRYAVTTYAVNQAKWEAARAFAKNRGWGFQILTESQVLGMK